MENTLQEIKRFLTHLICQHAFSPETKCRWNLWAFLTDSHEWKWKTTL